MFFKVILSSAGIVLAVGALAVGQPVGDYADAPDPNFPSLSASSGPCHLDVSQEWIGSAPASTTTVESDSLQVNGDSDDATVWWWRAPDACGVVKNWFGTALSYDTAASDPCDARYLNVLIDVNGSGTWDGGDEWAVRNFRVPFESLPAGVGTMYVVCRLPDSIDPNSLGGEWTRITLSDTNVPDGSGAWGGFERGETEDHPFVPMLPPGKVELFTSTRTLKAVPNSNWGQCPHGFGGRLTPVFPQFGTPHFFELRVPSNAVAIRLDLNQVPACRCPSPQCNRLHPLSRLLTPNWLLVADRLGGGPGPWFWPGPAPALPHGIVEGQVNSFPSWFSFTGWPGHDCVQVKATLVFDPSGEYVCVYDTETAMVVIGDYPYASGHSPTPGATEVPPHAVLSWTAGAYASSHDVYLGTDFEDVNSATTGSGVYMGNFEPNEYDPPGYLELETTYYWRIDEVNDACGPDLWKGQVWSFSTADYMILDDFEQYDLEQNRIQYTWYDQFSQEWGEATGAWLVLAKAPEKPVYRGDQAMLYIYDTDDPWADFYYAEAWLPLEEIGGFQDWTSVDVRLLTMFFYGQAGNEANQTEQMYVAIDDSFGTYAEIRYGDNEGEALSDIQVEQWQRWDIPFVYFGDGNFAAVPNDVDLSSVANVYVGFGNKRSPLPAGRGVVYFDDLRLNMPICKSEYGPTADLSGDCTVGYPDLRIVAEDWLETDALLVVEEPCEADLVGWWALDGDASDSSGNDHHGTAEGEYAWVAGRIGSGAIEFTDTGGKVLVPDHPQLRPTDEVSACAWVYYSMTQFSARVVVKGADNVETYIMLILGDDTMLFHVRDPNGSMYGADGGPISRDEWVHLAGTYDGTSVKAYVNGREMDSRDVAGLTLSQDTSGLAIGNRSDATNRAFIGEIDDVRVYDYGLSAAQVTYIAAEGTSYVPLVSEANLYDAEPAGEKSVNIRDFAVLANEWLEQRLWPE